MDPHRLVFVCPQLTTGGAEWQLVHLLSHLDRIRFRPRVIFYESAGEPADRIRELGIPLHHIPRARIGTCRFLYELRALLTDLRPDVLICRLPSAFRFGRAAAVGLGIPVVIAEERTTDAPFHVRNRFDALMNRIVPTWWTANSASVARAITKFRRVLPERIAVIHNGIDVARFAGCERVTPFLAHRRALGRRIVLHLGRLSVEKDQVQFLRAAKELQNEFPDTDWCLCGDGPELAALQQVAFDFGIIDRVIFLGNQTDVPAVLAGADLLVQTSVFEGLPNAVLEGMAAGLAIIATAVGGTTDLLPDQECGLLIPPRNLAALTDALRKCLTDRAFTETIATNAQARARQFFDAESMARNYEALFDGLLAGTGIPPTAERNRVASQLIRELMAE